MVLHLRTFKMSSWSSGSASKTESLPVLQTPCYIEWIEVTDVFHFLILIFANIEESPRAHSYSCGISIVNYNINKLSKQMKFHRLQVHQEVVVFL